MECKLTERITALDRRLEVDGGWHGGSEAKVGRLWTFIDVLFVAGVVGVVWAIGT